MLATILQISRSGPLWTIALMVALIAVVVFAFALSVGIRRYFHSGEKKSFAALGDSRTSPDLDKPEAFMNASVEAVIRRLREQERELAALHQREKLRAQQTERLSETVMRNMPAGMFTVSATGIVTSANPAAASALGFESLNFRRYTELFGANSSLARLLEGCLREGRTYRREELTYSAPDGQLRQLGVTISPILANDKQTGALCLLSDLTELKVLQKQMQLKENLAQLGEISAGIAHEFKNALATISGYAQMIRGEARDLDSAENAGKIVEQSRVLSHMVAEFLNFARPLDLQDEEVTLGPLVQRVAEEVQKSNPSAEITAQGNFGKVTGDEGLLRQALVNLALNAVQAAAPGKQPRVTLRGDIEHGPGHEFQRLTVLDNGSGISPQDLPKLFLPFYTTKATGTGLGLAIVQKIIVQHGGRVEAGNAPGGGAEFIVWLPLRTPAVRTVVPEAARA